MSKGVRKCQKKPTIWQKRPKTQTKETYYTTKETYYTTKETYYTLAHLTAENVWRKPSCLPSMPKP